MTIVERPLRVLYTSKIDLDEGTGPSVNEREFTAELSRLLGGDAHFLVNRSHGQATGGHETLFQYRRRGGVLISELRWLWTLHLTARRHQPDLLCIRVSVLPLSLAIFTLLFRGRVAVKTLGLGSYGVFAVRRPWGWRTLHRLNHWLYWIILRRALVVDVCTPQIRDIYEERLGLPRGKVHVVDNAVNCDVFNPRYPTDGDECVGLEGLTPIVGYIGNRPLTRGGQHLVAAAPFLREHFPSIGVLIVGGSDREARSLMDMATREGISECCMILPRVDYEMVPRYMALLDVGVALDEPARAALIGNASQKIRQYLATGLPVVGSVDGNVFLEAEGLGTLTKGDDQDEFIHAIAEWLGQNNDARAKHAARARQYAEKELSIGKAVRSRLRIWEDALRASAI